MNLYIYSYNNYYNRIVKKEGNLITDYIDFLHYGPLQGVYGFTPGDGVNTKQIIGSNVSMYDGKGDYLIAHNPNTNEIDSRWFIIDVNRTRNGQWELTLHRDLVVDYYDLIIDSPMFIEKATLREDSPFIFNSENVQLNEIKKAEYLLENNLKTPWVVAYLSRTDGEGNYNSFSGSFNYTPLTKFADYELDSLSDYKFFDWINKPYLVSPSIYFGCKYKDETKFNGIADFELYQNGFYPGNKTTPDNANVSTLPTKRSNVSLQLNNPSNYYNALMSAYNLSNTPDENGVVVNSISGLGTFEGYNLLQGENGKVIKVGNRYYQMYFEIGEKDIAFEPEERVLLTKGTAIYDAMFNAVRGCGLDYNAGTVLYAELVKSEILNMITLKYQDLGTNVSPDTITMEYSFGYNESVTKDASYEIIATPLKDTTFIIDNVGLEQTSFGEYGLEWLQSLYTASGGSIKVYDVQIVPYINLDDNDISKYEKIYLYEKNNQANKKAIAIKLTKSSFFLSLDISKKISLSKNIKLASETELWRITSPNGVGNFEFNPYKNNGFSIVEIDCTLKPINPYIKINPLFNPNGLYGGDYNDFRGLICNGDFSLSLLSSEWQTYQQQNKNFQAVFDREIQSMEFKNKLGKTQDIASAIAGSFTGIASGALTGAVVGGGIGAIPGAIVGGIASAAGGIADVSINEQLRNEALDYTKDMFGLNLGNIKARANTLTKSTSYNINNKYFPYIEFFTCTEEEKRALANKIAYNGMSLGIIGKMTDYINNFWSYGDIESQGYIKGQLIKLEFPINHKKQLHSEDFHVINAISNELYKGVYIK